jgi:hypothetical protein
VLAQDVVDRSFGSSLDVIDVRIGWRQFPRALNGQVDLLIQKLVQHLNACENAAADVKLCFVEGSIATCRPIFVTVGRAAIFKLKLTSEPSQFVLDVSV